MSSFRPSSKALAVITLSMFVLVGSTQIVSASSGGLASSINDYVHNRICERIAQLRITRPHFSLLTFCNDSHSRPTVDISASPLTITVGQSAAVSWNSHNATSCTASGSWSGAKVLNGSESVSPTTSGTYTLSCVNAQGSTSDSVTVTVNAAPQQPGLAFSANPTTITQGSTTLVSWSSVGTTRCHGSGGWSGTKSVAGSQSFSLSTTTDFGISCTGAGGTIYGTTTVTVLPTTMPSLTFVAAPSTISSGATSTLTWNSNNTSSCVASGGWSGSRALSGNSTVSPATTTIYVLTCHGLGGLRQATTTITVHPLPQATVTLTNVPGTIVNGATSTLSWGSTNATTCTAMGGWSGSKGLSGSFIVSPATTTVYVLNCTGTGGGTFATTTVAVTAAPMPTLTLTSQPATTTVGATSTLTWTSLHATSCVASLGWSGSPGLSGTLIVSPSTTTKYVLDCHGLGGHVQATTTVGITPTVALSSFSRALSTQFIEESSSIASIPDVPSVPDEPESPEIPESPESAESVDVGDIANETIVEESPQRTRGHIRVRGR